MLKAAVYSFNEFLKIKGEVTHYKKVCDEVQFNSPDDLDMKQYEPAMRHLMDTLINSLSRPISINLN